MRYDIKEGMDVIGENGENVGKVDKVLVGDQTKEPRFFTIEKGLIFSKDFLVPREAMTTVDNKGAHLAITKGQVESLPQHQGNPPTEQQARKACGAVGGRPGGQDNTFETLPLGGTTGTTTGTVGQTSGSRTTQRNQQNEPAGDVVTVERYLVLTPEERYQKGFRNEWEYRAETDPRS